MNDRRGPLEERDDDATPLNPEGGTGDGKLFNPAEGVQPGRGRSVPDRMTDASFNAVEGVPPGGSAADDAAGKAPAEEAEERAGNKRRD